MYTITGITGQVGTIAANLLIEKNLSVRAVLRNPKKGKEWKEKGAQVYIAELNDSLALAKAFEDSNGVFVMTPPLFDSTDPIVEHRFMLDALVDAIETAKPKKIVYLSSVGAHLPTGTGAIRKLYDMEQAFKKLSIPTVGIRAAWFMENFKGSIPTVVKTGVLDSFLNPLSLAIPMVATKDIGTLVASLLLEDWKGPRIIELSGPCDYSASDISFVLSYRLNQPVSANAISKEDYVQIYQSFGATPKAAEMMAEMNDGFNNKHITFEGGSHERINGLTLLEDALNFEI